MKIIINTSTLKLTGVCQVAASFINECKAHPNEYYVFLSPAVCENIQIDSFPRNFHFYNFGKDSLYSFKGMLDIFRMKALEKLLNPDIVFSVFGPSLWRPRAPHLQGFPYGNYIYNESPYFKMLNIKERISLNFKKFVHILLLKRNGDYYVCETDDVSSRLSDQFHIDASKVFTAYNTASAPFLDFKNNTNDKRGDNEFRFFTLCTPQKHKNLTILNEVIRLLKKKKLSYKVRFYLTLPEWVIKQYFQDDVLDCIVNMGPQKVVDCPKIVSMCDALFLPTLLECFSANYPESMLLHKPVTTSDLPFARTICKDAAIYFDPLNAVEIADKLERLVNNPDLYDLYAKLGDERVKIFGSASDRAKRYLSLCQDIINQCV